MGGRRRTRCPRERDLTCARSGATSTRFWSNQKTPCSHADFRDSSRPSFISSPATRSRCPLARQPAYHRSDIVRDRKTRNTEARDERLDGMWVQVRGSGPARSLRWSWSWSKTINWEETLEWGECGGTPGAPLLKSRRRVHREEYAPSHYISFLSQVYLLMDLVHPTRSK